MQSIESVRQTISSYLQLHHGRFDYTLTIEKASSIHSAYYTYADIKEIVSDMVESGRLFREGESLLLNQAFEDIPERADYEVNSPKALRDVSIEGTTRVVSIGSEDYHINFEGIKESDAILVSLIPEPENKYDYNAVAITHNDKIMGYLERRFSSKVQETIIEMNDKGENAVAQARLVIEKELDGMKYLSLNLNI